MRRTVLLIFLAVYPLLLRAESLKLPVVADAGVTNERGHQEDNSGSSVTVPVRQNQNWSGFETKAFLMRFDTGPLRGMTVEKAWLNIFLARGELYAAGLCTVLADWVEGGGLNGQTGRGGASWNWRREPGRGRTPGPENRWAWLESGIYSVSWAHPDARYSHAGPGEIEKKSLDQVILHLRIPVAPELVEALAAGLADGLILTDDKGQVAEGLSIKGRGTPYKYDRSQDIFVYTRDIQDPSLRPFMEVEARTVDNTPPGRVGSLEVSSVEPAEPSVTVAFIAPSEDGSSGGAALGYEVRFSPGPLSGQDWENAARLPLWAVPRPEAPGARQLLRVFTLPPGTYHLAVRVVDEAGNRGEFSVCQITVPALQEVSLKVPRSGAAISSGGPLLLENRLELWACPDLCKVDPLGGGILLDSENYRQDEQFRLDNPVWSSREKTVSLQALKGEVAAFQLILSRVGETKLTGIAVTPSDLSGPSGVIRAEGNLSVFRVWYLDVVPRREELVGPWELVEDRDHRPAWHGDACLPLEAPFQRSFDLPTLDNLGPGQRCQAVWVDLYVPPETKPGIYRGKLRVTAKELSAPASVDLKVEVLPLSMPGQISWVVDLNAYDYGINHVFGVDVEKDPGRYHNIERRCYQLAHQHRATLCILPYAQDGSVQAGCAPPLEGGGKDLRIASWKDWDRRFGQYLDGKAFTRSMGYRGPGEGVPLTHMYLPFNEDWPLLCRDHYGDWADLRTREEFVEWAKKSRPLEKAFDQDYQEGFVSVVRQFFEHFKNKGFTGTNFQTYFNNKYYFKVKFFAMPDEGRGSSFWLLDEPVDYDDYAANRFFLSLVKNGYELARAEKVRIHYRTDVSQPEMSRGLWDGVCDLWNSSGLSDFNATASFRMSRIPGEKYWHYGGGPEISGRLIRFQSSFFTFWCMGTDGELPYWNNLGSPSWFQPDNLTILYSGTDYARSGKNYDGPLASVRLKAMRRAQQDIEMLQLLAARPGWSRKKVRMALAAWADDPGAATLTFYRLTADRLLDLRRSLAAALLTG